MGMSASQVRYCMLQARKSDIEFQGQQINQQRTTLATQSAAYNTELLTLSVPTPPSTEEFTKTTYSYTYNGADYTIQGVNYMNNDYTVTNPDGTTVQYDAGTYVINYSTKEIVDKGSKGSRYAVTSTKTTVNDEEKTTYYVTLNGSSYELSKVLEFADDDEHVYDEETVTHNSNAKILKRDFGDSHEIEAEEVLYQTEISQGKYIYFTEEDLINYIANPSTTKTGAQAYQVAAQSETVYGKMYGASITWTDTGRMSAVADSKGRTCTLDVNTTSDDSAYSQAYNEYLYQRDMYNKQMDDINSKLEVIQAQDKRLELQLRNLDTQETAIKTEMEAVKKVCTENIEKSFNVFG